MKTKFAVQIIILILNIFAVIFIGSLYAQEYNIVQLTDNSDNDCYPKIENNKAVWIRPFYGSIFFYDGANISKLTSDDSFNTTNPEISDGQVVWSSYVGDYRQIFLYNGTDIIQLTNDEFHQLDYQIDEGQITWADSANRIYLYKKGQITQIAEFSNIYDLRFYNPRIDNGQVVWSGMEDNNDQIYFYDGQDVTIVPNPSGLVGLGPDIDNKQIVWAGLGSGIYFFNGENTILIPGFALYDDSPPRIEHGQIVWGDHDGKWRQIYFYNGKEVIKLANDGYHNSKPQINNGQIVWEGRNGAISDIFLYDGKSIIQLTKNGRNRNPQISNGQVIWEGHDGNDYEIFLVKIFMRGDVNDDGLINISDAVFVLRYIFASGSAPKIKEAADVNGDGNINVADPIYLLDYLFQGGPQPPK